MHAMLSKYDKGVKSWTVFLTEEICFSAAKGNQFIERKLIMSYLAYIKYRKPVTCLWECWMHRIYYIKINSVNGFLIILYSSYTH